MFGNNKARRLQAALELALSQRDEALRQHHELTRLYQRAIDRLA